MIQKAELALLRQKVPWWHDVQVKDLEWTLPMIIS